MGRYQVNAATGLLDLVGSTGAGSGTVTSVGGGVGWTPTPDPIVGAGVGNLDINDLTTETVLADGDLFAFVDVSAGGSAIDNQRKVTFANLKSSVLASNFYQTMQEEGVGLTQRAALNFVGGGFTAADDAGNGRTNLTLDADLNAIAALGSVGFAVRIASDQWALRSIAVTDSASVDFTITSGNGVGGNPTITASVIAAGVDHGGLGGLADDDHTQYTLRAGRAGATNDTTLSTTTLGILAGSSAAGQGLKLYGSTNADAGTIQLQPQVTDVTALTAATFVGASVPPTLSIDDVEFVVGLEVGSVRLIRSSWTITANAPDSTLLGVYYDPTVQNPDGVARTFPQSTIFTSTPNHESRNAASTVPSYVGFADLPIFTGVGTGTLTVTLGISYLAEMDLAGSTTMTSRVGFQYADQRFASFGAQSTILGLYVKDQTSSGAFTLAAAVRSEMASGTNKWALYSDGTAVSSHKGALRLGDNTAPTDILEANGNSLLDGKVRVWPNMPAPTSNTDVITWAPTHTTTTNGLIVRGIVLNPTLTLSNTIGFTAIDGSGIYQQNVAPGTTIFTFINAAPTLRGGTAVGQRPPSTSIYYDATVIEQNNAVALTGAGLHMGYVSAPTVRSTISGATIRASVEHFNAVATFTTVLGSTTVIPDRWGLVIDNASISGAGTLTFTTQTGILISDLTGAVTNLGLRSQGTLVEMRYAGPAVFGADAGPANASTGLELQSTTRAFLPSRLTTTQRDALTPVDGMLIYESTNGIHQGRQAGAWVDIPPTLYAPGSTTITTGRFRAHVKRLQLTGTRRLTLQGTARFSIYN